MTSTKLLSFALVAVIIIVMMGRCSAYGNDEIRQCSGRCYIHQDGHQEGCPPGCGCISDRFNDRIYIGGGHCYTIAHSSG
ncbi:hypothetical protein V5799_006638 [Amblyomma americanum]|uniref:Secreted protein n=1 Tax=Amblyomma americanum TaxID=6943 RepID=A0AAQ4DVU0_AMBAM